MLRPALLFRPSWRRHSERWLFGPAQQSARSLPAVTLRDFPRVRRKSGGFLTELRICEGLSRLLAPHTVDRGLYYEFHIDETPRDLWMINGLWPPASGSEAEQLWVRENRPVPY
ncbi:tautomerase family protein [Dactylosporangium sp. CA-139066]|uniref:tautomerase family protein n=1 Tax=Dactylosporangium sp. CA-139066 TaxID=3239930 RepID=UPI003D8DBBCA